MDDESWRHWSACSGADVKDARLPPPDAGGASGARGGADACFKCGESGHWASACPGRGGGAAGGRGGGAGGRGSGTIPSNTWLPYKRGASAMEPAPAPPRTGIRAFFTPKPVAPAPGAGRGGGGQSCATSTCALETREVVLLSTADA